MSKRLRMVTFKVDDDEYARLDSDARAQGLTRSELLRRSALGGASRPVPPPAGAGAPEAHPVESADTPERPAEVPSPTAPVGRLTPEVYQLDDIGPDPYRGGEGSLRR